MIRLVLGLGNPGEEYRSTRHNVGFRVVDELARRWAVRLERLECNALAALVEPPWPLAAAPPAGEAVVSPPAADATVSPAAAPAAGPAAIGSIGSIGAIGAIGAPGAVLLAKPQTYMNRSGYAARCLIERHELDSASVLVVYDEVNLPLGRLRLRRSGSPAGHRGIESILENLRTDQVARLRVGISGPDGPVAAAALVDFVLSPFTVAEEETLAPILERAADACEAWLREGIDAAMSRFNGG